MDVGPEEDEFYVASCDLAGESRPKDSGTVSNKRDSTVFTIARVGYNDLGLPSIEIVYQKIWLGMPYLEQYGMICELCNIWGVRKIVVDKTGLGEGMASLLTTKFGEDQVISFHFTRQSKSELAYYFLSLINSGRLKIYAPDEAPQDVYQECITQLYKARYSVPSENILNFYCDVNDCHDDV